MTMRQRQKRRTPSEGGGGAAGTPRTGGGGGGAHAPRSLQKEPRPPRVADPGFCGGGTSLLFEPPRLEIP